MQKIEEAMCGVLFVDEACALIPADGRGFDFGHVTVATLKKAIKNRRGQFIEFSEYTRKELCEIALGFLSKKKYTINEDALIKVLDVTDYFRARPNFANARTVRNILDQVIMNQNLRE